MTRKPPEDVERLNAMAQAVHTVFCERNADNMDRIDVLAKLAGCTIAWGVLPDAEAAFVEAVAHAVGEDGFGFNAREDQGKPIGQQCRIKRPGLDDAQAAADPE